MLNVLKNIINKIKKYTSSGWNCGIQFYFRNLFLLSMIFFFSYHIFKCLILKFYDDIPV
jgi:hypothetical protein